MFKKIYLIRHGHIDLGDEKKYLGITDLPLDALGKEQAHALQRYFHSIPLDAIFTSSLNRCLETTDILCQGKQISYHIEEALREIDMGEWENVAMSYIKSKYPKLYIQRWEDLEYFCPPKGESFHQLHERVSKAFHDIVASTHNTIAIVAHAGVNRVLLASLMGIRMNDIFCIEQSYGCVYEIVFDSEDERGECRRVL